MFTVRHPPFLSFSWHIYENIINMNVHYFPVTYAKEKGISIYASSLHNGIKFIAKGYLLSVILVMVYLEFFFFTGFFCS